MRLPPLTALRTFECAGRKLSFTAAAQELGVTPGAVSRQIRLLEDLLDASLFTRTSREVVLTPIGEEYLRELAEAFQQIGRATERLFEVPDDAPLRVATSPTFILRWLMPRLKGYHASHPGHNLQLTMAVGQTNFRRDAVDATVKLGQEDTPHAIVRRMFSADLVAVCSPRLLEMGHPLRSVDDLAHHTLLHSTVRTHNWQRWLAAAGAPDLESSSNLKFESSSLAYQAAIESVGVAIAQVPLILDEIKSGHLVTPFPITCPDIDDYNLIWPERAPRNRGLQQFRDWIMAQAKVTEDEVKAFRIELAAKRS